LKPDAALKFVIRMYDMAWPLAIPFLRRHRRLSDGFAQRLADPPPRPSDIWIQAASAGEAYLAIELTKSILSARSASILLTTNTLQGFELLEAFASGNTRPTGRGEVQVAYFPFDRPAIMQRVTDAVKPQVMVLLETEIWPGHLLALKQSGSKVLLINGRLTARSLKRYLIWPDLWSQVGPDHVLAVSRQDAGRFKRLFATTPVGTMPNMKFDRMGGPTGQTSSTAVLADLIPADHPFVILGSIRKKEEEQIGRLLTDLHRRLPQAVIGLFPRHMDRIAHWQKWLRKTNLTWQLRSNLNHAVEAGSIILWDRFGELPAAYTLAEAAFVGGSLAPLGGQNFLEPLITGIRPVIGPNWDNFSWVGEEIEDAGLLMVAADWLRAAELLAQTVAHNRPRASVRSAAQDYIAARRGGTRQATELVIKNLVDGVD